MLLTYDFFFEWDAARWLRRNGIRVYTNNFVSLFLLDRERRAAAAHVGDTKSTKKALPATNQLAHQARVTNMISL